MAVWGAVKLVTQIDRKKRNFDERVLVKCGRQLTWQRTGGVSVSCQMGRYIIDKEKRPFCVSVKLAPD